MVQSSHTKFGDIFGEISRFIVFSELQPWGGSSPSAALGLVVCFPGKSPILRSTQCLWLVTDGTTCGLPPNEIQVQRSVGSENTWSHMTTNLLPLCRSEMSPDPSIGFLTLQFSELSALWGSRKDTVCSSPSQAVTVRAESLQLVTTAK